MTHSPDTAGEARACEVLLCHGLHPEARAVVKRRYLDWLAHAQGCRRRAHEYKRWALEDEQAGNLARYHHYRKESDRQWRMAWDALVHARREFNSIYGARQWH